MALPILAEEVSFLYPQNRRGLASVSLAVEQGRGLLVSGASGCGKSSLARCLAGLIPHLYRGDMSGCVRLGGHRTTETPLWRLSELAGLVFQNPALQMLAPTVEEEILFGLENLGLAPPEMDIRLEEALERFGLGRLRKRSPQTLSGGEQQKVALASILARRPPVLVLDEPLSMLDTTAAVEFVDHLENLLAGGQSLVVCEHRAGYLKDLAVLDTIPLESAVDGKGTGLESDSGEGIPYPDRRGALELVIDRLNVRLGEQLVLNDFTLSLSGGQVVAILGRNGVGKTTLLRALAGLQMPESGTVKVHNGAGAEPPAFGVVFQNPDLQLFNPTVREEILYRVPDPDQALYDWLISALGLVRYAETPPLLLSEGEKRRLALATALIRRPPHGVLLDEPSMGQDGLHKTMLAKMLHRVAGSGSLVAIATHDLELAACADTIILLDRNGIAARGPADEVMADRAAWARAGLLQPDWMDLSCSI